MAVDNEKLVKLITSRQAKLESDKSEFNERMKEAAEYVAPHREDIYGTLKRGAKKGTKIYDGTAQGAAVLAADGIHGYHVSPAFPWFKYVMNRKEVNKIPEIRSWLQELEFNMYLALNRSNFYSEIWMYIYDGLTLGSPSVYAEEDIVNERIVFESIHPGELFIEEDQYGEVDVLHRKRKMSARKIIRKFGDSNVPVEVRQTYEKDPFTEFEVIHAVFPRDEYDTRKMSKENKRYASVWLLSAGNKILLNSGYDTFPHHVWRYIRSGKEPYAITPATLCMAAIRSANIREKTDLGARQMALDPPLNVPAYMEGNLQWKPRGINYYDPGKSDKGVYPANTGSNFLAADESLDRVQRAIKEAFHVDTFLMLASLEGRGQRTAYEVSELMAEKAAVLGAELGPLNTEIGDVLESVYDIEKAAGRMPPPPDMLLEMADKDRFLRFDPVYMGPLAQAQRERFQKDGIRKFFSEIAPIAQINPEVMDKVDTDMAIDILGDIDGVPQELIVPTDKVKQIRAARLKAMQQQNALQEGLDMASGLKDAAAADKNMGGKLSDSIMGGMNG